MFAHMKESDYMTKPTFLKNFWEGFKEVLGPGHVIKSLDKCDFTPMFDQFKAAWEKKKAEPKEVWWGEGGEQKGTLVLTGEGAGDLTTRAVQLRQHNCTMLRLVVICPRVVHSCQ